MSNAVQLMPGQSPPIAIITPTDQRGVLWIVTPFCLVAVIVSVLIRAYVRVEFSQSYGKDDISIFGAFVCFHQELHLDQKQSLIWIAYVHSSIQPCHV
jgi:hypothetical protein